MFLMQALGSLYLIHNRVEPVFLWNFTGEHLYMYMYLRVSGIRALGGAMIRGL